MAGHSPELSESNLTSLVDQNYEKLTLRSNDKTINKIYRDLAVSRRRRFCTTLQNKYDKF